MRHCKIDAEFLDVWYLDNIKGFSNRRLELFVCPVCKIKLGNLIETRISDGVVFINKLEGPKLEKVTSIEKDRILYTYLQSQSPTFFKDWVVGVNSAITTRKGKITQIRQYASGYRNSKKVLVKRVKVG